MRWLPHLMRAVPSRTNPAPRSTNRPNQVWSMGNTLPPLYVICDCNPVLSTDNALLSAEKLR